MSLKIAKEEVVRMKDASPLDLFRQGIRAEETRDKYTRTLRQVLCKFLEDILEGDFEARARQFVSYAKEDLDWMLALLNLSRKLRERTELPAGNSEYPNPDSMGNYFKPLKNLLDMNNVAVPWKRVYATFPELDNMPTSKSWTREDIAGMLRHARDPMERALVLASSGMRAGGLDLNWEDLTPIYRAGNGGITLDPDPDDTVACAVLHVYRGSPERYLAFITPEAFDTLHEYGRACRDEMPSAASEGSHIPSAEWHAQERVHKDTQGQGGQDGRQGRAARLQTIPEVQGLHHERLPAVLEQDVQGVRVRRVGAGLDHKKGVHDVNCCVNGVCCKLAPRVET